MEIALISHASVVIRSHDAQVWCDPWLTGKVFNASWTLLVPPAPVDLAGISHLWISHEHPDHFNIPTLRNLPAEFRQRVRVLFQANNSDKMFAALHRLGFPNTQALPHRQRVQISPGTAVYCYQVGQMDSCLAVLSQDTCILNINDAEANHRDCSLMRSDLGSVQVVLNQFSLAGYSGEADRAKLPVKARQVITNMLANHCDLSADTTIPIASFVYFSSVDNAYMNAFVNTPRTVADAFAAAGLGLTVVGPGECYSHGQAWANEPRLRAYDELYASIPRLPLDPVIPATRDDLATAAAALATRLQAGYPDWLLRRWLTPVTIAIIDLNETIVLDLARGQITTATTSSPDLSVYAQPLLFALQHPFGVQTLGVSARLVVHRNAHLWRRHRILLAMFNAEVYLHPRLLLTRRNLAFLRARLRGGLGQLRYQLSRMR